MTFLYNTILFFYHLAIKLASIFNPKAKLWIEGRRDVYALLVEVEKVKDKKKIWMHVASLGEFEQGRPVIEALKDRYPDCHIILSFFSPSGYEIRKDYPLADTICYLPLDTKKNAKRFIETIQPDLVIFVKYEFWYHYLHTLKENKIPTLLISAIFREQQIFFKPYGKLFKNMLNTFNAIFVQDEFSISLLSKVYKGEIIKAGDTRIDRVLDIAAQKKSFPIIEKFKGDAKVFIIGSSWPEDEKLLAKLSREEVLKDWKFIIAPHQIDEAHIREIEGRFPNTLRYTDCKDKEDVEALAKAKTMIINTIGMLSSLYAYGDIAYIGGGFGKGIHNTLEPIAFGLPVLFGPKYLKFNEAVQLVKRGGGFAIKGYKDLKSITIYLQKQETHLKAQQAIQEFLHENKGATQKVMNQISVSNLLNL